jgi:hypothetical protein
VTTTPQPKKLFGKPSQKLAQMLKDATPEQRAQAARIEAALLAKRARNG